MGAGPALRLAHTAVLAAVCVVVSGLGHALSSDGASPSLWGYLVVIPPVCAAAWRLTRTERSARCVVAASAAGQLALHMLFGLVAHPPAGGGGLHPPGHTGMARAPSGGVLDPSALTPLTGAMGMAHLLAGAVCGWWLWRGERALVQLSRALRLFAGGRLRFVRTVLCGVCLPPVPLRVPPGHGAPVRAPASLVSLRALPRRGPPALSF
ncbi:hypothetical protein [Streptomyces sp. NPDC001985]|uniref:hypothetical protein n=1 Tax=Streptomyces sp. NPDC001985 TaxID=3154406 RepID=UPI003320BDE4